MDYSLIAVLTGPVLLALVLVIINQRNTIAQLAQAERLASSKYQLLDRLCRSKQVEIDFE